MRIVSLNAWGGRLHEPLMPYLVNVEADVLCLQEMVRTQGADADWLVYRDHGIELLQRANLFEELKAALPAYDAFFLPVARGDLFEGDRRFDSEFGLATFVRRTYPIIGQAAGFVHGEFSADGYGPHPRSRNAHCIRLFDYERGYPITIAHMHGLRDLEGKGDTPARRHQANALVDLIRQVKHEGDRLVVCGDFNLLPGSETFDILSSLGLADLVTSRGYEDTRTSHYKKQPRFADYMLVTSNVEVITFDPVAEPEVSDHRALLLDLK
ncbi:MULTISPECIES: endonuclease/exonuclease/phosphatase family protein [Rhizobium]|uniref:Endonuclease/exonuclease/phosphatase family metal-dependent hydrolase n=1 Tax=Rhizobium tropici TaxID=398 RepID=A0A6P1C5S1_RHITR|nr:MULTISPECIES: endonuclease/exonuclease/phosphatase family protein [Rhizobium]AGB70945.1 putative endonuclease/exonuclease/phosphatase [Rhizobium tropici CIAT 899]MBB4242463.1 endonuclease/exonuclease/phosphatase family metal-dependent hydrolase [Rhizobium tropici]MBB5594106.1 endonuclease/exonuclease/phosphatase family metal-dependent hydrolase [Rhizobium tropici]MBB6492773.1 endonuclease/exonuclease/phosphatase family metal-dependent hydrolase [Rhizobium tropici]NEV11746.1 endonuclease/exo